MQRQLDQELAENRRLLLSMAAYAETAVSHSIQAVLDRDDALAQQVIEEDTILDRYEMELDEQAIHLLALQAPVATDLRKIVATMKITTNLERVGDEATKIARRALALNKAPAGQEFVDLPRLANLVMEMLKQTREALVQGNLEWSRSIIARDPTIDALNQQMQQTLVDFMTANPVNIARCVHLMVVCKCLERIADHAKNMAEVVIFLVEARDVRHSAHPKVILPFASPIPPPPE